MASNGTVSIRFKIDGDRDFKNLIVSADGLRDAFHATLSEAEKLDQQIIHDYANKAI